MEAGGGGISGQPLRLASIVRNMAAMPHGTGSATPPDRRKWQEWLAAAAAAEIAHGLMTSWLRSRMPGYPFILAPPQLAPGAPLTTDGFGQPRPWTTQERREGLQLREPPPEITRRLNTAGPEARRIAVGTQALGTALQGTGGWQRMQAATDALAGTARAELGQARRTILQRLGEAEVGRVHPAARLDYRKAVVAEALVALSGPAAEYAQAFEAANLALETAAVEVFGQLAVYGQPTLVRNPLDVDLRPGSRGQLVSFTRPPTSGGATLPHLDVGQLLWLEDELVPDAAHLTNLEYSYEELTGERERYTATLLPGTGRAWKH
jgi:hypothetical protein